MNQIWNFPHQVCTSHIVRLSNHWTPVHLQNIIMIMKFLPSDKFSNPSDIILTLLIDLHTHLNAFIQLIRIPPHIRLQTIIWSCGTDFIQMVMMERRFVMHFHIKNLKWISKNSLPLKITLSWTEIYASTWNNSGGASYVSQWKSTTGPSPKSEKIRVVKRTLRLWMNRKKWEFLDWNFPHSILTPSLPATFFGLFLHTKHPPFILALYLYDVVVRMTVSPVSQSTSAGWVKASLNVRLYARKNFPLVLIRKHMKVGQMRYMGCECFHCTQ